MYFRGIGMTEVKSVRLAQSDEMMEMPDSGIT
jgi:hypothetical protein